MPAAKAQPTGESLSDKTEALLDDVQQYSAGGFGPLPGFISSANGSTLVDVDGKRILDFAVTMGTVNLGHCNPEVTRAVVKSLQSASQTNIAVNDSQWPLLAKTLCQKTGYDKVASMVSGAEAADAAVKIARKWGIEVKHIPPQELLVLGCSENYHGLSSGIWPIMNPGCGQEEYGISSSNVTNVDPETGRVLRYGNAEDYEEVISRSHHRIAAVIMEPIHGTLPTFAEEIHFARSVRTLCKQHNILFISDEVRMGSGKTGKFLCSDWLGPEHKPDMITLGKSISGGVYPAAYILGYNDTMSLIRPNQVASTYAMGPAANAATLAALKLYSDERLLARARLVEEKWFDVVAEWKKHPFIQYATARGADLVIMLNEGYNGVTARRIARLAYQRGVLIYPQKPRLRCSVALTITDEELEEGFRILTGVMDEVESYAEIPGSTHVVDDVSAGF